MRRRTDFKAADVGTGSGALALAVLEPSIEHVYATDSSIEALAVARINGSRYRLETRVSWLKGDLLEPLPEPVDLIVSNLPYVPDASSQAVAAFEPSMAMFGGSDGLDLLRRFPLQVPSKLRPGGAIVLEVGPNQGPAVANALLEADSRLIVESPPNVEQILIAELPG